MHNVNLSQCFIFRNIESTETDQAIRIEQICFPINEACSAQMMRKRISVAPELFLVAVDRQAGTLAGFLNGLATREDKFRDEFFTDATLYDPNGANVMLLGLDVLPDYRNCGLARTLVSRYRKREAAKGRKMLVLTCLTDKIEMYEKMDFVNQGLSASVWGGEHWYEMTCDLSKHES